MTTLNNRALSALSAGVGPFSRDLKVCPAVVAVVAYAAQNPGLDPADYCGYAAGYRSDSRRATQGFKLVREAVRACHYASVTDADVIEASRHDRLTVAPGASCERCNGSGRWIIATHANGFEDTADCPDCEGRSHKSVSVTYCTGQYWPTEYRHACARVLQRAAEIARGRAENVA